LWPFQRAFRTGSSYALVTGDAAGTVETRMLSDEVTLASTSLGPIPIARVDMVDVDDDGIDDVLATHLGVEDKPTYCLDPATLAEKWRSECNTSFGELGSSYRKSRGEVQRGDIDADGEMELVIPWYGSGNCGERYYHINILCASNGTLERTISGAFVAPPILCRDGFLGRHHLITTRNDSGNLFGYNWCDVAAFDPCTGSAEVWFNEKYLLGAVSSQTAAGVVRFWGYSYPQSDEKSFYVADGSGEILWKMGDDGSFRNCLHGGDLLSDGGEYLVLAKASAGSASISAYQVEGGLEVWTHRQTNGISDVRVLLVDDLGGDDAGEVLAWFGCTTGSLFQAMDGRNGSVLWQVSYTNSAPFLELACASPGVSVPAKGVLLAIDNTVVEHDGLSGSLLSSHTFSTNVTAFAVAAVGQSGSAGGPSMWIEGGSWVITCEPEAIGSSSRKERVAIHNRGDTELLIHVAGLGGPDAGAFAVELLDYTLEAVDGCSLFLQAGARCYVDVRCTPRREGACFASLVLRTNDRLDSNRELRLCLRGSGTPASLAFEAKWPFSPIHDETVLYVGPGRHNALGNAYLADLFCGKIVYATADDGSALPSKVLALDPESGESTVIVAQPYYKFSALKSMGGALYVASEDGSMWKYDGVTTHTLSASPFHYGSFVTAMVEFNGRMLFGTSAAGVYWSVDGESFSPVVPVMEQVRLIIKASVGGGDEAVFAGGGAIRAFLPFEDAVFGLPETVVRYATHGFTTDWHHYYVFQSYEGKSWLPVPLYRRWGGDCTVSGGAVSPYGLHLHYSGLATQTTTDGERWSGFSSFHASGLGGRATYVPSLARLFVPGMQEGRMRMFSTLGRCLEEPLDLAHGYSSLIARDGKLYAIGSQDPLDPDSSPYVVAMLGGYRDFGPELEIKDASGQDEDGLVAFAPTQIPLQAETHEISLRNAGNEDLSIAGFVISGPHAGDFTAEVRDSTGAIVAAPNFIVTPNETLVVGLTFQPFGAGGREAVLMFHTNDPDDGEDTVTLELAGTGLLSGPEVTVVDSDSDSGDLVVAFEPTRLGDTSRCERITVLNEGGYMLTVSGLALAGEHAADYRMAVRDAAGASVEPESFSIATNSLRVIEVVFAPSQLGVRLADVRFSTTDPDGDEGAIMVSLSGEGVSSGPELDISDNSGNTGDLVVDFGPTRVGTSGRSLEFVLHNVGEEPLNISQFELVGLDVEDFDLIVTDDEGAVVHGDSFRIEPQEQCRVEVVFTPAETGARQASISFMSDDPDDSEDHVLLSLQGTGVAGSESYVLLVGDSGGKLTVKGVSSGATLYSTNLDASAIAFIGLDDLDDDGGADILVSHLDPARAPAVRLSYPGFREEWRTSDWVAFTKYGHECAGNYPYRADVDLDGTLDLVLPRDGVVGVFRLSDGQLMQTYPPYKDNLHFPGFCFTDEANSHFMYTASHPLLLAEPYGWITFAYLLDLTDDAYSPMALMWKDSGGGTMIENSPWIGGVQSSMTDGAPRLWTGRWNGGAGRTLVVADTRARELWTRSYGGDGQAWAVYGGDLRGDGVEALLVGGEHSYGQAQLDAVKLTNGDVLWSFVDTDAHFGVYIAAVEDVTADGAKDVFILTDGAEHGNGTKFQMINGINGVRLWQEEYPYSSHIPVTARFADVDADSDTEILVGVGSTIEARSALTGQLVREYSFGTSITAFVVANVGTPAPPTALSGHALDPFSICLNWQPSVLAVEYVVTRNGIVVGTTSVPYFGDAGLEPATDYTYTITASNSVGDSAASVPVIIQTQPLVEGGRITVRDSQGSDQDRTVHFGRVTVGAVSAVEHFSLSNSGNRALSVSNVLATGDAGGETWFEVKDCDELPIHLEVFEIAPDSYVTVAVSQTPSSTGIRSAQIGFRCDDPWESEVMLLLYTEGVEPNGPTLVISDSTGDRYDCSISLPATRVASTSNCERFYLWNAGDEVLSITGFSVGGEDSADFVVRMTDDAGDIVAGDSFSLPPGGIGTCSVWMKPTLATAKSANVVFESNDPSNGVCALIMSGIGVPQGPEIDVTDTSGPTHDLTVGFEDTHSGRISPVESFIVRNVGDSLLNASGLRLVGPAAEHFEVTLWDESGVEVNSNAWAVTPGAAATLKCRFAPMHEGEHWGVIEFATDDNDGNEEYQALSLFGKALSQSWPFVTLQIFSPHGNANPEVGVHTNEWGSTILASVSSPEVHGSTQYVCRGWVLHGGVDTNGQDQAIGTNMVAVLTNDCYLTWQWRTNYWLDTEAGSGGWVAQPDQWVVAGSNVVITGLASNHYHFSLWEGDTNGCGLAGNVITAVMTQARSITAVFEIDRHVLTVSSAHGGAWPGTETADYGTALSQWVTNSPVAGGVGTQYVCMAAQVTGNALTQIRPANVTLTLTNDAALTWNWRTELYLATGTNGCGSVDVAGSWVAEGSNVLITATPCDHWHFAGWSGDTNGCTVSSNTIEVAMDESRSITAEFLIDQHSLVVSSVHGGATPPSGTNLYDHGSSVSCAVTNSPLSLGVLATQYVCVGWVGTGSLANGTGTNVAFTVTNDSSLAWTWRTNYWLAVAAGDNGRVAFTNGWVVARSNVSVLAVADSYYHLEIWTGTVVSTDNPLDLLVVRPHDLLALFAENLATNDVPEWWLAQHGWTSNFSQAAMLDGDRDGMPTWQEWHADTDPSESNSVLRIRGMSRTGGGTLVRWDGGTSAWQYLLRKTDLMATGEPWTAVFTNPPPTAPTVELPVPGTADGKGFYRVRAERK
jgi:hypothetical protein